MNKQHVLPNDLLDIIFQDRNKTYGAYELRKNYHRRAKRSFLLTITLIGAAFSLPVLAELLSKPPVIHLPPKKPVDTLILIADPTPPPPPPPIEPPIHSSGGNVKTIIPEIADADTLLTQTDNLSFQPNLPGAAPGPGEMPTGGMNISGFDTGMVTTKILPPAPVEKPKEDIMETEMVEENAQFPGGENALSAYIHEHLHFTKNALSEGLQGKVVVSFVVNKNGKLSDLEIVRPIGYGMDEEVLRVIQGMPEWISARYHGKPVRVRYLLPIALETTD